LYVKIFEGTDFINIPEVDYYYDQIETQNNIEDFSIQVLFTPGHTWGSVCLLIENCLFSGDTLFNEKIGRIDLPGGDEQSLKKSLKTIAKLPKHICIYPGHGTTSTIKNELKYNKTFIQALEWA